MSDAIVAAIKPAILSAYGDRASGGGGFSPEAMALFAAMTTPPSDPRKTLINNAIVGMKASGGWDLLDVFWVTAAADAQAAGLNWKNPGTFTLTAVNSPPFTIDRGYAGDGSTSYVDTNYDPSINAINLTQNDAFAGLWSQTSGTMNRSFGWLVGTNGITLQPGNGSSFSARLNTGNTTTSAVSGGQTGWFTADRTSSSNVNLYKNGTLLGSGGQGSVAIVSGTLKLNMSSAGTYTTLQGSAMGAGKSMSALQEAAFYAALLPYMQGVGAA